MYDGTPPNQKCPCGSGKTYKNCHAKLKKASPDEQFNAYAGLTEATPNKILSRHRAAARQILGGLPSVGQLTFVPRKRDPNAKEDDCFPNVAAIVQAKGGERVLGWKMWECNHWIKAVYHAILRRKDGELVCVTPERNEKQILFLIDPRERPSLQVPPIVIAKSEAFNNAVEALIAKETIELRLQWKNADNIPQTQAEQLQFAQARANYEAILKQTLLQAGIIMPAPPAPF